VGTPPKLSKENPNSSPFPERSAKEIFVGTLTKEIREIPYSRDKKSRNSHGKKLKTKKTSQR
jgi:hypothetical protein